MRDEELIQRFLDGELEPKERQVVATRLETDQAFAQLYRDFHAVQRIYDRAFELTEPVPEPGPAFERLLERSGARARVSPGGGLRWFQSWRPIPLAFSAAVGFALALIILPGSPIHVPRLEDQLTLRVAGEGSQLREARTAYIDAIELAKQGETEEARSRAEESLRIRNQFLGSRDSRVLESLILLVHLELKVGNVDRAALLLRRTADTLDEP